MKMPGFTAEASLYRTGEQYHVAGSGEAVKSSRMVSPQLLSIGVGRGEYACYLGCRSRGASRSTCEFLCFASGRTPPFISLR